MANLLAKRRRLNKRKDDVTSSLHEFVGDVQNTKKKVAAQGVADRFASKFGSSSGSNGSGSSAISGIRKTSLTPNILNATQGVADKFASSTNVSDGEGAKSGNALAGIRAENVKLRKENEGFKAHDKNVAKDIASGATQYGEIKGGGIGQNIKRDNLSAGRYEIEGAPKYEAPDTDQLLQTITGEVDKYYQPRRTQLEQAIANERESFQQDIKGERDRVERQKEGALARYFGSEGGREGAASTANLGMVANIENAGMEGIKKMERDLKEMNIHGQELLLNMDDQERAEVMQKIERKVKEHNATFDKKVSSWKANRDEIRKEEKFEWGKAKDIDSSKLSWEKEKRAARKELSGDLFKLYDKFGGKMAGGALAEYFNEEGIDFDLDALMEAENTEDIKDQLLSDAKMAAAFSKLDPATREYVLSELPDQEQAVKMGILNENLKTQTARTKQEEIDEFERKEQAKFDIFDKKQETSFETWKKKEELKSGRRLEDWEYKEKYKRENKISTNNNKTGGSGGGSTVSGEGIKKSGENSYSDGSTAISKKLAKGRLKSIGVNGAKLKLDEVAAAGVNKIADDMAAIGLNFKPSGGTGSYRSSESQNALFAQGKSKARGGQSNHNYGMALDMHPMFNGNKEHEQKVINAMNQNGWYQVEEILGWDRGHFEYRGVPEIKTASSSKTEPETKLAKIEEKEESLSVAEKQDKEYDEEIARLLKLTGSLT